MLFKSSKLNEFRLWGLLLTMCGLGLMLLGTAGLILWGDKAKIGLYASITIGLITMAGSMVVYFWAGVLSTSAITLECPECGKPTKILGKTDRCMFCKTILTLDPAYAPVGGHVEGHTKAAGKEKTSPGGDSAHQPD